MSRITVALCAALLAFSCGRLGCGSDASLAELIEIHGRSVQRDFAASVGKWQQADVGARFAIGDGVRVGENAQGVLRLNDGSLVTVPPRSQLRFRAAAADGSEQGLAVEVGQAEIKVAGEDLVLHTELGLAVLHAGSKVVLEHSGPQRLRLKVEVGTAQIQPSGGSLRYLAAGQTVEVGIGMAIIEPVAPAPATPSTENAATAVPVVAPVQAPADPSAQPARADGTGAGAALPTAEALPPPGPARTSLEAGAGDSFSVHASRQPVPIALAVGSRCPGEAVLEILGKHRTRGQGKVSVALGFGAYAYAVTCLNPDGTGAGEPLATGTINVVRDAGTAQLPARAPTALIDTDGKRYTVMYQNLLPRITVQWPKAPASSRYVVEVDTEGKQAKWSSERSRYELKPGALREGTHTLQMTTPDGARSQPTTLVIRFDNAAPKASVSKPRDGAFAPGSQVEVAGVALPGFQVSLPGGTLEVDAQSRFKGTVTTTAERPDVVLRIESPRSGVHYYVRRASGGS